MIRLCLLLAISCLVAPQARAQSLAPTKASERPAQKNDREASVPKEYMPPPGMCRIWVDNVPANRQPAPTDCTTAIRNRPPNARVVFGPGRKNDGKSIEKGRVRQDTLPRRKPPE